MDAPHPGRPPGRHLDAIHLLYPGGLPFGIFHPFYKKEYLQAEVKDVQNTIAYLQEEYRITNRKLLLLCLCLLGFTISLFIVHGLLHMQPSVAAMTGAMLLLVFFRVDIVEMLEHEVEWPTLIFFMALFIVIAGADETGLIQFIAEGVREVSGGSLTVAIIMVLWVSALASAFIDNIPFTVTMLPVIAFLNQTIPGRRQRRPVVVPGPGGLPGRQRHHDRGVGQCSGGGDGGKGGLPHFFPELYEGLLSPHAHRHHPLHGLPAAAVLRRWSLLPEGWKADWKGLF